MGFARICPCPTAWLVPFKDSAVILNLAQIKAPWLSASKALSTVGDTAWSQTHSPTNN
jgi:hypothetical protein